MRRDKLNIDDSTIVEECKRGDRDAMSLLYTRFAPRMLHVIARYVQDREDALDILHDGFIAAFTRLDSLRDPERVDYWLASIMKNLSLKFLQSQNVASILDELPETGEDPDLDEVIDFATLESLISQLPDGYQKVFRLAVLENKSHKEISKILGIAPNSSSSQLFRARIMLRRLITEYRHQAAFMIMLLIAATAGIFFIARYDSAELPNLSLPEYANSTVNGNSVDSFTKESDLPNETNIVSTSNTYASNAPTPISASNISTATKMSVAAKQTDDPELEESAKSSPTDNDHTYDETTSATTSSKEIANDSIPKIDYDAYFSNLYAAVPHTTSRNKVWSAGIAFDPGVLSFESFDINNSLNDALPPYQNPSDPSDDPQTPPDDKEVLTPMKADRIDMLTIDELGTLYHKNYLPITFALTAERRLSSQLGLESGISYTYLHTDFEGKHVTATCHWHYLELPLKVNLYFCQSSRFSIYGAFGGKLSVPVYSNASSQTPDKDGTYARGRFSSNPIWSAGGSIGISYKLSDIINIYVEPSLQYHFPHEYTVPNVWTDDPWTFSIPLGIRFSW